MPTSASPRNAGNFRTYAAQPRSSALATDERLDHLRRLGGTLRADAQRLELPFACPCPHWHGPGKIPHAPSMLESRGCSLLELRYWSLTTTGLRLALRV